MVLPLLQRTYIIVTPLWRFALIQPSWLTGRKKLHTATDILHQ